MLPLTKKSGPARQKSFSLITAYLREYGAKILKLICLDRSKRAEETNDLTINTSSAPSLSPFTDGRYIRPGCLGDHCL